MAAALTHILSDVSSAPLVIDTASEMKLVPLLASLLERVLDANNSLAVSRSSLSSKAIPTGLEVFFSFRIPPITILDYLARIVEFSSSSPSCLIVAMVYIERLVVKQPGLVLTYFNVHRLLVTATLLAVKFLEDLHYDNKYWAKIAGVSLSDLNKLEAVFLAQLDWKMNISEEIFAKYYLGLLATATPDSGNADDDDDVESMSSASSECSSSPPSPAPSSCGSYSSSPEVRQPTKQQRARDERPTAW